MAKKTKTPTPRVVEIYQPVPLPTVAELLSRYRTNAPEFTFGDWVAANGWDVKKAVEALNSLMLDPGPQPMLAQLEVDAEDNGVWDGDFQMIDGKPAFVGADGPSGGSREVTRQRFLHASDVIELA